MPEDKQKGWPNAKISAFLEKTISWIITNLKMNSL
jgi:hypothetical protein